MWKVQLPDKRNKICMTSSLITEVHQKRLIIWETLRTDANDPLAVKFDLCADCDGILYSTKKTSTNPHAV